MVFFIPKTPPIRIGLYLNSKELPCSCKVYAGCGTLAAMSTPHFEISLLKLKKNARLSRSRAFLLRRKTEF
jgi:hypothetical protein